MSENPEDKELLRLRKILKDSPKRVPPESFYQGVFARIESKQAQKKNAWWGYPAKALASACVVMLAVWVARETKPVLTPQSVPKQNVLSRNAEFKERARLDRPVAKDEIPNEVADSREADKMQVQVSGSLREEARAPAADAPAAPQKKKVGYVGARSKTTTEEQMLSEDNKATVSKESPSQPLSSRRDVVYQARDMEGVASQNSFDRGASGENRKQASGPATEWKESSSGISRPRTVVVRDATSWQRLWEEHSQGRYPLPPLPPVDFNSSIVVGVFAGAKPNTAYSVAITHIEDIDGVLTVYYAEPTRDGIAGQMITSPFHLRVVPKTTSRIQFKKR